MSRRWQPKVKTYGRLPLTALLMVALLPGGLPAAATDAAPPPAPDPVAGLKSLTPRLAPQNTDASQQSSPAAAKSDLSTATAQPATSSQAPARQQPAAPSGQAQGAKAGQAVTHGCTAPAQSSAAAPAAGAKSAAGKGAFKAGTKTAGTMPPTAPPIEKYAQVGALEKLMFGVAQPNIPIEYRLDRLESEVFHLTNPEWEPQRRINRLSNTLLGGGATGADSAAPPAVAGDRGLSSTEIAPQTGSATTFGYGGAAAACMPPANPYLAPLPTERSIPLDGDLAAQPQNYLPPPPEANSPEFTKPLSRDQLEQYALQLINDVRYRQGLQPLEWDKVAYKVSKDLVTDLCRRNTVSHQDTNGDNPDVRYTKAGGNDCLVESVVSLKTKGSQLTPNKQMVYNLLKELFSHQDDRDSLLSAHATNFAFTFDISSGRDKLIGCAETVTKQAEIDPIPAEVHVGDKIDVKGVIKGPYHFQKITVAWEGIPLPDDSDVQDEAEPYFPPLDYEAFARKSEHDWSKQQRLLQLGGIGLALAGGVFIPPVALAAPLIAAAGSTQKPKAVSEIPVHGGVHVDGAAFEHKTQLNKDGKEGIYYITVWAESEVDGQPFAVSRRAVIVKPAATASDGQTISHGGDRKLLTANEEKREQKREKE